MNQTSSNRPVAVIVAMQKELDLLLPLVDSLTTSVTASGHEYHEGTIGPSRRPIVLTRCGIGKVNAALSTSELLRACSPSLVINTGVAGGAGGSAGVLDVVVGREVAYHDVWCGPGTEHGCAAGCPPRFEAPADLLELKSIAPSATVRHGLICSGDIFVSKAEEVTSIRSTHPDVLAIDMESAAIAQTCWLAGVPFLALRVVSDTPGAADNISQYENFWDDAPRHTFELVSSLIAELPD